MSRQPADLNGIHVDLDAPIIRAGGGAELPYKPIKAQDVTPMTVQETAEAVRMHALFEEQARFDKICSVFYIILLLVALYLAIKGAKKLYSVAKRPGRASLVYSLFLAIRGTRKASSVAKSFWSDAKAIDRRVPELERSGPE